MKSRGTTKASKVLVPLFLLISTFCAVSTIASGVLIFSSWDTLEKATTDAERLSGVLEQKATTMEATVNDRNVFRVVVAVATDEDRSALEQTAKDKKLQPWFLSTEKLNEMASAPVAPDSTLSTGETAEVPSATEPQANVVLSVNNADPDAVLQYLDQATINSTIAKLDAVRKRAQELIQDFEPRSIEQPAIEEVIEIQPEEEEVPPDSQTEQVEETEEQPETSSTE